MNKGAYGEALAADFLAERGHAILYRNWRSGIYEIDLITRHGDELVFVEVRTLSVCTPWYPEETIGPRKRARLLRAIGAFYQQEPTWQTYPARIDIVGVRLGSIPEILHIEDAFR